MRLVASIAVRPRLGWLCVLPALASILIPTHVSAATKATASWCSAPSPDYPSGACWIPADPSNFSYANRPHGYPIDMIVIHDIEGDSASAIADFQTPNFAGSAHYVVGYDGSITQMVREHDIAWHAGNWDYNSRAIGIEHAGFACCNYYTTAEYNASAALAASICSRYGVPMDRNHVIGHYQVPDPFNPGLYGGVDHHTDPGNYWDWTYYMATAQNDTLSLPSPPHMMPDPTATNGTTSGTVTWQPARTCRAADKPITGYTVTSTPATTTMSLAASATSATFTGLTPGTSYTFTVTAINGDGQDSATSNAVIPGRCNSTQLTAAPASPQNWGTTVQFSSTSAGCPNPQYDFMTLAPGSSMWTQLQAYSSASTYTWSTSSSAPGAYTFRVMARDAASPGTYASPQGTYDDYNDLGYSLNPTPCGAVTITAAPASPQASGTHVVFTAAASGCHDPRYEFWMRPATQSNWQMVQPYGTAATYSWNSTGAAPGVVYFGVWARDASSSAAYDTVASTPFTVAGPNCPSVTVTASPTSVNSGGHVTATASATGCASSPRYEFWVRPASSSTWILAQPYGAGATYDWNSTGAAGGTVYLGVWVRDANSTAAYDAVASTPVTVTAPSCASVTISASPATVVHSTTSGTHVTVTAAASGCTNSPLYEFWIRPASSSTWQRVQAYGTSATYDWNSTGAAPGTVYIGVHVRDSQSGASYDAVASTAVTVT